jgi:FeS assembly SUF system regulator
MLKLSKRVDYGLIALRHLALQDTNSSAKEIAARYGIPVPLMSKVLQSLARSGLLASEHGTNGGYRLARAPGMISALEAIRAIEGPIALADCFGEDGSCDRSARCTVRRPLRKVHEGILGLLDSITIMDLSEGGPPDGLLRLDAGVPELTRL